MRNNNSSLLKNIITFSLSSRLALILFIEILISLILVLIALFAFLKLGQDVFAKEVFNFDAVVTDYIYQLRGPNMTIFMLLVTSLANPLLLLFLSMLTVLYLYSSRPKDAVIFSLILYSGIAINLILKEIFKRPRPEVSPLIDVTLYSFPSGHAMNSFVFFSTLSYFIWRKTKSKKLTIIATSISVVLIFIIGVSRVYLGVHYPSDVIAGFIGGFIWFISAVLFEKTIIFERMYRAAKSEIKK